MNSESDNTNKSQHTEKQEQQDNANAAETVDRERISRLADDLASRAKGRQVRYDKGHEIFTK
jgi:hypothetical protein